MSATLAPPMFLQFLNPNNSGSPAIGFKLFTYLAGTTTKQATWTDSTQGVQNANPLLLDANGAGVLWGDPTIAYKFVWAPANDTDPPTSPLRTEDNLYFPVTTPLAISEVEADILAKTNAPVLASLARTAAEISAGVTPTNYTWSGRPIIDPLRYGMKADGVTDDHGAFVNAMAVAAQFGGKVQLPGGTILIGSAFTIPSNIVIEGLGQGNTTIKRGFTGNFCTSRASNSILRDLTIDGNTATWGAGTGITFPANSTAQQDYNIEVTNFVSACLDFSAQYSASEFASYGCTYFTTGTQGSVAAVKGPTVQETLANPRMFFGTVSNGCTLFDFGQCNHWWAYGFFTNGLIFSSANAYNVVLSGMRCGSLGGTITCQGSSFWIDGVSAVAWANQAHDSYLRVQTPNYAITESGAAANNSIELINPTYVTYTGAECVWTAASVNPSLGNGTIVTRLSRRGAWWKVQIELTLGSTTTQGTGAWQFSLPQAASSANPSQVCGTCKIANGSGGTGWTGAVEIAAGASVAIPYIAASETTIIGIQSGSPTVWTTGAILRMDFEYRVS